MAMILKFIHDLNDPSGKSMYESIAKNGMGGKQGIPNKSLLLSPNTNHPDWIQR